MIINGVFLPSQKEFYDHLERYADYVKPAELIDWCAEVSPYRTLRVIKVLQKYKGKNAKVLDLGCGTGLNTPSLAKAFPRTTACDVEPRLAEATRDFLTKFKLKVPVVTYDGKRLPFKDKSFDLISCIEVYEHAKNPGMLLKEIRRVLKPDGVLHITAPNKLWPIEGHYQLLFLSYLPKKLADLYVRMTGKGPGYENIYILPTYRQFRKSVEKYFDVEDITFDVVINYKEYGVDKERGEGVKYLAKFLKIVKSIRLLNNLLINLSVGWLFIAKPRIQL